MLNVHLDVKGLQRFDFDKKEIKPRMRKIGGQVSKEAKRLLSRRTTSGAGDMPGLKSGALRRSIKHRVSRPGLSVSIAPRRTSEIGKGKWDYYAAFLLHGSSRGLAPRDNYIAHAMERQENFIQEQLSIAARDSVKAFWIR